MRRGILGIIIFASLSLGAVAGFVLAGSIKTQEKTDEYSYSEERQGGYKFINPLLECVSGEDIGGVPGFNLDEDMEQLVDKIEKEDNSWHISVYYRDLKSIYWFGINEGEKFIPASLLKVPLMIGYFKLAENNPDIPTKKIKFEKESDALVPFFQPSKKIEVGKSYSADELIYRMIVYSDNEAKSLLLENFGTDILSKVFEDMHLDLELGSDEKVMVTVKDYSSFFRILYNATYLDRDYSEKALDYLSRSEFRKGLVAGVPKDTIVAHKFGERNINGQRQLHDCGIVYHPVSPYVLCVMTKGEDYIKMSKIIKEISAWVYDKVDKKQRRPS